MCIHNLRKRRSLFPTSRKYGLLLYGGILTKNSYVISHHILYLKEKPGFRLWTISTTVPKSCFFLYFTLPSAYVYLYIVHNCVKNNQFFLKQASPPLYPHTYINVSYERLLFIASKITASKCNLSKLELFLQ